MVMKATGLSSGHWYECPNGHTYAIADCGGAVVESRCPECKERIGGRGHQLNQNNRQSSLMGNTRPTYDPTNYQANLEAAMRLHRQENG